MKLFIKNMVCKRCKLVVNSILSELDIPHKTIELGEVEIVDSISTQKRVQLGEMLSYYGLELMDEGNNSLIKQIKGAITDYVQHEDDPILIKISAYLAQKLKKSYNTLAVFFSKTQGTTIRDYIILQKIEKVKELLLGQNLTLSEIAYRLNYSSVAHLASQFRKVTGQTSSDFILNTNFKNRVNPQTTAQLRQVSA